MNFSSICHVVMTLPELDLTHGETLADLLFPATRARHAAIRRHSGPYESGSPANPSG